MGYSIFDQKINGVERDAGYGVIAYCDAKGCFNKIDRGMSYACCGAIHHDNSCGGFFCADHELVPIHESDFEDLEEDELEEDLASYGLDELPIFDEDGYAWIHAKGEHELELKTHKEWADWVSTDESWAEWREKYPEKLKFLIEDAEKWTALELKSKEQAETTQEAE